MATPSAILSILLEANTTQAVAKLTQYQQKVDKVERTARKGIRTRLDGNFDNRAFVKYQEATARAARRTADRKAFRAELGANFSPAGFTAYERQLDRVARETATKSAKARESMRRNFAAAGQFAAAGIGVAGFAVGKLAVDFDKAMRNVNSIAQLPERSFKDLEKQVLSLAGKTAQAPKTLAEGLYDLVSSGFDAQQSMTILASSAKAATAGLTDTATATKAVSAVLNAYHEPASKAAAVSDTLFQTVNLGVISFEQLANTIGDVLPFASQLHVSLNQVGAAVSTMTKAGIGPEETMTRIKNVFVALLKPSKDLSAAIKETGASSGEALIKQKGLQGALEAIVATTNGSKSAIASLFPNIRALGGALALTGTNAKGADRDLKAFGNTSGATNKALSQQSQSISHNLATLKATVEALAIGFASKAIPVILKFVEQMRSGTGAGGQFARAVSGAFNTVKTAVTGLVGVMGGLGNTVRVAVGAFVAVKITQFALALQAMFTTIRASPVGAFFTAVGLLAGVFLALSNRQHTAAQTAREVADAWDKAKDSADQLRDSNLQVVQAKLDHIKADQALTQAQHAVTKAADRYGKNSPQYKAAEEALAQAKIDSKRASNDLEEAERSAGKARQQSTTDTRAAIKASQSAIDSDRNNIKSLNALITTLDREGAGQQKNTTGANALRDAQQQLSAAARKLAQDQQNLNAQLNAMPGRKLTDIKVEVDFASNISNAIDQIAHQVGGHFAPLKSTPAFHYSGGLVTQPGYFAGEEAPRHPEVILATNPAYRKRNLGLFAQAGNMLGVPGFAQGGLSSMDSSVVSDVSPWTSQVASAWMKPKAASWVKGVVTKMQAAAAAAGGTGPSPLAGPPGVQRMIAAANEIASHNYNYEWGGGHNSGFAPTHGVGHGSGPGIGYDCSGAVSRMLHANGLLASPLVSGGFMNYGSPGAGKWITLYSSPTHVFSEISGRYFGTSGQNPGGGANWIPTFPGDIGAITHPTGFAEGGIFEHAKQKTFGAFDPSQFSPRDQAMFVKTGLLPGLAKGGIFGAAGPSPPSRDQIGAFYKVAHALWARLSGAGALPAWNRHEPKFHVQQAGWGGDKGWGARAYTTPSRQIYVPWNVVWDAEHPQNKDYLWAQESLVHEMAHTLQNKDVWANPTLREGGAQAWADYHGSQAISGWKGEGAGDSIYAGMANWVRQHKGPNWINHGQFARYAKGGIFGRAKAAAAAKAPGFLRGGLYTASEYDSHGTGAGGLVSDVQSVPGFAELSNPPSSDNWSALGHLPFGTKINVTYRGKTITIPKLDVGAGGGAIPPATVRAVDLTMPAARELNFPGLANVIVSGGGAGGGGLPGGGVTVTTSGGGGSSPTTTAGGKPVKPKPKFVPTKVPKLKLPFKLSNVPAGATPVISGLVGELNKIYDPDRGSIAALTDRIGVVGQIDDQKVSEYQTAHPATDTSTGLIETSSTDASGNTTTHHTVDQKFVDMRVAQLTKLIIWQTQVRDYLKAARRKIDILLHRLHQALEIRRRFAQKIHDDIERNVARIQELQAQEKVPKISRRHKSDLAASIQALKNQNKQLGGNDMRAGNGGVLGKIGKEITSLTDTASTMRDNRLQIVGASGIGGTLGTSKLDLKTTADELAVISPKSVQAALAAATTADIAAAGGTTPAVDDSGTIQMLQQLLDQAHLATSVSQAQLSILQATPPFGGSFAQGGVVPGPAGVPRTIIAHGGETVGQPGDVNVHLHIAPGMEWLKQFIQVEVNQTTRGDSVKATRTLPGHKARF